jgi:uncharacterized Zn-binding protein involved in type VI secretion
MGQPAAKQGDRVTATDIHIVLVPAPPGPPLPTPLPHLFDGVLLTNLSPNVNIMGRPAATHGSQATNTPIHVPMAPGVSFQKPPTNTATVVVGSATVRINGKPAARNGDQALTCNDPVDVPIGLIVATGTVMIGS